MQSIEKKIINRIRGHRKGWAFSQKDFADLGSRSSVDVALHSMAKKGAIRRLSRGIYDFPKKGKLIPGLLSPDLYQVAKAIARKFGNTLQPSGSTALNALGLTRQVPSKHIYGWEGPNRTYHIDGVPLEFRRIPIKDICRGQTAYLVQALRALGKDGCDKNALAQMRRATDPSAKKRILRDAKYMTGWVFDAVTEICSR